MISAQAARRYEAVPVGFDADKVLMIAMADPSNVLALDDLRLMTGEELRPVVASKEDIAGVICRMSRLDDAVAAAVDEEQEIEEITNIRESADDAPVIKLVNSIVADAVEQGASDIHFEPEAGSEMRVRFRVDGVLSRPHHDPQAHGSRRDLAREDHGQPGHRGAARAPGRARGDDRREALDRPARRHPADQPTARASPCESSTRSRC